MRTKCRAFAAVIVALCGAAVSSALPHATAQERHPKPNIGPTGCDAYGQTNGNLQNNQTFRFYGGKCGGTITLNVTFSGREQFNNGEGSEEPSVAIEVIKESDGQSMCDGQNVHDRKFNTFALSCSVTAKLPPFERETYIVRYETNNVANLPVLNTEFAYDPD